MFVIDSFKGCLFRACQEASDLTGPLLESIRGGLVVLVRVSQEASITQISINQISVLILSVGGVHMGLSYHPKAPMALKAEGREKGDIDVAPCQSKGLGKLLGFLLVSCRGIRSTRA